MTKLRLQSLRFVVVGLGSNLLIFNLYLLVTTFGIDPKFAMTLLFVLGTMQTFFFNKSWTFAHRGLLQASFLKYLGIYSFAYLLNLTAMLVLVDKLGYPHQVVQGMMILALALMLFLLQKYWVFRASEPTLTH